METELDLGALEILASYLHRSPMRWFVVLRAKRVVKHEAVTQPLRVRWHPSVRA